MGNFKVVISGEIKKGKVKEFEETIKRIKADENLVDEFDFITAFFARGEYRILYGDYTGWHFIEFDNPDIGMNDMEDFVLFVARFLEPQDIAFYDGAGDYYGFRIKEDETVSVLEQVVVESGVVLDDINGAMKGIFGNGDENNAGKI